ncbi:hypothetical protein SFRURICE_017084 [Spodoptera frugiperda]|nr:hypothetical protein SFRURICE_017084 [Spodoptera frugiperda]
MKFWRRQQDHLRISNYLFVSMSNLNRIDKDVQSLLFPLHLMQTIVLNKQYYIKNNIIRPNNCFIKFVSLCSISFYIGICLYRTLEISLDPNLRRFVKIKFLYFASICDFFFYSSGFILNFIRTCVKTNKMVLFVLTFQDVHRFLHREVSFKFTLVSIWMPVVLIFLFYCFTLTFMSVTPFHIVFILVNLISLDANHVYFIVVTKLLTCKLELWNERLLFVLENGDDEVHSNEMFSAYKNILSCYEILRDVYQQPILYQTIETFFRCLVNIKVMIEFGNMFLIKSPYVSLFLYTGMIKTLVIQLTISLRLQLFYDTIKCGQDLSKRVLLYSQCTEFQKKLCKNVRREHRASFRKLSACGLFYVDICHPLHLIALLTNYTVVLLQFAFL